MGRSSRSIVRGLAVFSLLLLAPAAWAKSPAERADALTRKALDALGEGDAGKAYALAGKAIALDDTNVRAHFLRGRLLLQLAEGTDDEQVRADALDAARADLTVVAQLAAGTPLADEAHAFLDDDLGQILLPDPTFTCPAEATATNDLAEAAWQRHDLAAARTLYDAALAGCPENAEWWLYSGDAWFDAGDYAQAMRRYGKAIELAPCYASAYRFRADAWRKQGDEARAIVDATAAVACNPTYTMGWSWLADVWSERARRVTWQRTHRPSAEESATGPASAAVWRDYWAARGTPVDGESSLSRERRAVEQALRTWEALPAADRAPGRVWPELAEARDAGALDAAIYIWLLDADLAPDFLTWRVDHHAELVTYISEHLVEAR